MVMEKLNRVKEKTEEKLTSETDEDERKILQEAIVSYNSYIRIIPTKILIKNCDDFQDYPQSSNDYLKEYIPKRPDEPNYIAETELTNLKKNEAMFKYASNKFLQKIKNYDGSSRPPSLNLINIGEANDPSVMTMTAADLAIFMPNIQPSIVDRSTGSRGGEKRSFTNLESENYLSNMMIMPDYNKRAMIRPASKFFNPKNFLPPLPPNMKDGEDELMPSSKKRLISEPPLQPMNSEEKDNDIQEDEKNDDDSFDIANDAAGLVRVAAEPITRQQNFTPEELQKFFENSYKCNVGNSIKNYIVLINKVQSTYGNLMEDNDSSTSGEMRVDDSSTSGEMRVEDSSTSEDDIDYESKFEDMPASKNSKLMVISIFLKNIDFINKSFYPNINSQTIIDNFNRVDNSYSVSKMNSLLDIYSSQLEMYSLIQEIMNSNDVEDNAINDEDNMSNDNEEDNNYYTRGQLAKLFDNSISDVTLFSIGSPYNKYEIEKKILLGLGDDESVPQVNEEEVHRDDDIHNDEATNIIHNDTAGGNTKKRRNNKKIMKTRNNKKVNSKKKTIKKRNRKHIKNTKKH
jgi:hypothetical protein